MAGPGTGHQSREEEPSKQIQGQMQSDEVQVQGIDLMSWTLNQRRPLASQWIHHHVTGFVFCACSSQPSLEESDRHGLRVLSAGVPRSPDCHRVVHHVFGHGLFGGLAKHGSTSRFVPKLNSGRRVTVTESGHPCTAADKGGFRGLDDCLS